MKYLINVETEKQYIFSETGKVDENGIVDKVVIVISFDGSKKFPWVIIGDAYPNPLSLDPKSSLQDVDWSPNADIVLRQVVGRYLIGENIT